jgi:hypothetical protein
LKKNGPRRSSTSRQWPIKRSNLGFAKYYRTAKDTIAAENLIDCINASNNALAWRTAMPFNYFRMALHSSAENWIKLFCETKPEFQTTWNFIKPLFKEGFGKKLDVAKIGIVLDNL